MENLTNEIDTFLAEKGLAASSVCTYRILLRQFLEWLGRNQIETQHVTAPDVIRYLDEHLWGISSRYQRACAIRSYMRWKHGATHPATRVKIKRKGRRPQRSLTLEQAKMLIASFDTFTAAGIRNRAMVSLMIDSGLREAEICRLRVVDTDMSGCKLGVIVKGGAWGEGIFSAQTARLLEEWLMVRAKIAQAGVDTLFVSVGGTKPGMPITPSGLRVIFRRISKSVGFTISPHDCRRSFAVLLTEAGAPTELVRRAGRWASHSMVQLYTQNAHVDPIRKFLPMAGQDETASQPGREEDGKPLRTAEYDEYQ